MKCWSTAGAEERRLFGAISVCLRQSPHLLGFLFDPDQPRLRTSPEGLLAEATALCSGDYLLVKVAVDLWTSGGFVSLHELFDAEPVVFASILEALASLAPRPSRLELALSHSRIG